MGILLSCISSKYGGTQMAVTTKTQTEQIHTKASSGTESTTPGEQLIRDELKEASQQFFNTLFRVGLPLPLAPVYLLPQDPRDHFLTPSPASPPAFTTL